MVRSSLRSRSRATPLLLLGLAALSLLSAYAPPGLGIAVAEDVIVAPKVLPSAATLLVYGTLIECLAKAAFLMLRPEELMIEAFPTEVDKPSSSAVRVLATEQGIFNLGIALNLFIACILRSGLAIAVITGLILASFVLNGQIRRAKMNWLPGFAALAVIFTVSLLRAKVCTNMLPIDQYLAAGAGLFFGFWFLMEPTTPLEKSHPAMKERVGTTGYMACLELMEVRGVLFLGWGLMTCAEPLRFSMATGCFLMQCVHFVYHMYASFASNHPFKPGMSNLATTFVLVLVGACSILV